MTITIVGMKEPNPDCAHCHFSPLVFAWGQERKLTRQQLAIKMLEIASDLFATDIAQGVTGEVPIETVIEGAQNVLAHAMQSGIAQLIAAGLMKPRAGK